MVGHFLIPLIREYGNVGLFAAIAERLGRVRSLYRWMSSRKTGAECNEHAGWEDAPTLN
jgi:hypothetical protein